MATHVSSNVLLCLIIIGGIQGLHMNIENGRSGSASQEAGKSLKYIPLNSLTLLKHHKLKTGEETTTKLWWENLPEKRKDKNKVILQELDKLTEAVPNWPWLGSGNPSSQSSMSPTEIPSLLQSSLMPYDLGQDEPKMEKVVSSSGDILGDIIVPMRTAVAVQPVDGPASSRDDLINLEDIAPFSLNEDKRSQAIKAATEDPKVRSSPWPWLAKNSVQTETDDAEVDQGHLPDWSWLINKFGKAETEDQVTGSPFHVAKTLDSTEAELDDSEVDSTTVALFPEWFLNAFGSNVSVETDPDASLDVETTTLHQNSDATTLKMISEDIEESTTKNPTTTLTPEDPSPSSSTMSPSTTPKPKPLGSNVSTHLKPFNVTANLRKVSANEKSDFVRPSPKVKLHANRVYFNRPTAAPFSSAEPVIKLDPQSIAPDTGKPNSGFDLNYFPQKSTNTSTTDGAKFPSLSQFERESSTQKVEIPPHSAAETRETFDHLTSLYTSSPIGQSMYKNKVASAIFVAQGKPGVQSKIQGVNIEMKDHESVPFKVNDTKTISEIEDQNGNMTSILSTMAPSMEEKPQVSNFYQNPVKVDPNLKEVVTDEPTSATEKLTQTQDVVPPIGILEHIRKLLELNNGLIETLQSHLSDQKKILGHILDAASTNQEKLN